MNFSEEEFKAFQAKQRQLVENLQAKFASRKSIMDNLTQRVKGNCKVCRMSVEDMDNQLNILQNVNLTVLQGEIIQAKDPNCPQEKKIKEAAIISGCFGAWILCVISLSAETAGIGAIACTIVYASCCIVAECDNCGCPW
jgi:hypothetical protein